MQQQQASDNGTNQHLNSLDDFLKPEDLVKQYPDKFTLPQIKWFIRNRQRNELAASGALVMVSARIYISVPKFTTWFASQQA